MWTLRGRWLHIRCRCGDSASHPVKLMLREQPERLGQTAADVLVTLRSAGRQGRHRLAIHLFEYGHGIGALPKSVKPGWALPPHDTAGPEFAARYGLSVGTLRDWEQGRSQPDRPAQTLLRVIDREPKDGGSPAGLRAVGSSAPRSAQAL